MGFYIRKSVSVGPFRFNLSKSGIGVSAGVKGLRFGTGPRGNYVHMGRGGLYYRATLPPGGQQRQPAFPAFDPSGATGDEFQSIESGDVRRMVDGSSADLLREINSKRSRPLRWPWAAVLGVVLTVAVNSLGAPVPIVLLVAIVASLATGWLYWRDEVTKSVVLFYELDEHVEQRYEDLQEAFRHLAACKRTWHIEARNDSIEQKRNAGANTLLRRKAVTFRFGTPPDIKTNIQVPVIPAGDETLYLFPDRLLVYSRGAVGAIGYAQLSVETGVTRFVETEPVPADSEVAGSTWQYVNKSGGPDRRFAYNPEIPVALYGEVHLRSDTGLNELFHVSRAGAGTAFQRAIEKMAIAEPGGTARLPSDEILSSASESATGHRPAPTASSESTDQQDPMFNLFKRSVAPNMPAAGQFEATVSGDVDFVLRGEAIFGVSREKGDDGAPDYDLFCLLLKHESREGDGEHIVTMTNRLPEAPSEGRYTLGDMGPQSLVAIYNHTTEGGNSGTYTPERGRLEIARSGPVDLAGAFEFSGKGFNTFNVWAPTEGTIRIFGTFNASRTPDACALARASLGREDAEHGVGDDPLLTRDPLADINGSDDLEVFAESVIENMVMKTFYPGLIDLFATAGYGPHDINRVEAFLFQVFPIDNLTRLPHFAERSDEMRVAFRSAVEKQVATLANIRLDRAAALVKERFAEYSDAAFDETGFLVKDDGMVELSHVAYRAIFGGSTENYNLLVALFEHFHATSRVWEFGAKLKELHEHYEVLGDAMWVADGDEDDDWG